VFATILPPTAHTPLKSLKLTVRNGHARSTLAIYLLAPVSIHIHTMFDDKLPFFKEYIQVRIRLLLSFMMYTMEQVVLQNSYINKIGADIY